MDEVSSSPHRDVCDNPASGDAKTTHKHKRKKPAKPLQTHHAVEDSGYESRSGESTECCSPLIVLDTLNCVNVASFELAHTTDEVYTSSHVESSRVRNSSSDDDTDHEEEEAELDEQEHTDDLNTSQNPKSSNAKPDVAQISLERHNIEIQITQCNEDCIKGSGSCAGVKCTCNQHTTLEEEEASSHSVNVGNNPPSFSGQTQPAPTPTPSTSSIYLVNSPPRTPPPFPFASLGMNLSFCGAGFLGIYHLGTAQVLARHGQGVLLNTQHYLGASAGSLVAAVLAVRGPDLDMIKESVDFTLGLAESVRQRPLGLLTPRLSLLDSLESFLDRTVPDNAPELANGRLHVSLTTFPRQRSVRVSEFSSKQHLIKCLLASSYVPFATGTGPVRIDGQLYMDGGMTDNLPMPDNGGQTICVSPFAGRQEICPGRKHKQNEPNPTLDSPNTPRRRQRKDVYVTINKQTFQVNRENIVRGLHAFFPPPPEVLRSYYRQGQMDAMAFLKAQGWWEVRKGFEEEDAEGVSEEDVLIKGFTDKGADSDTKC